MKNSTLLCVDDDLGILEFYETMLGSNGLLSKGAPVEEILARIEFLLCLKREASAFSIS